MGHREGHMSHKIERIEAKRLYLEENLSLEDIQKRMPQVSIASLYRWSAEEKWDAEREEVALTAFSSHRTILKMITKKLDEIAKSGVIYPSESDSLTKLAKTVKTLFRDIDSYGNIILAVGEFTEFMAERDQELLDKLHPYLIEFGNAMSKKYGKGK
jgi:hypothetical protein